MPHDRFDPRKRSRPHHLVMSRKCQQEKSLALGNAHAEHGPTNSRYGSPLRLGRDLGAQRTDVGEFPEQVTFLDFSPEAREL